MIPVQYRISTLQDISLLTHVETALQAGCKWIQLQVKDDTNPIEIKDLTHIKELCREQEATFIIEDHVELVKAIDGDGIHITTDISLIEIRQQLGEGFLIGANAVDTEDILRKKQQTADYICYGPFSSSPNAVTPTKRLQDLEEAAFFCQEKGIDLPICAYGQILPEMAQPIMNTGMRGISIKIEEDCIHEDLVCNTLKRYLSL